MSGYAELDPGLVLEALDAIGTVTSARNSEVIHAGLYYPAHTLKARMCLRGRELLYQRMAQWGAPTKQVGKLIVGTELDEDELRAELQELEQDELHSRLVGADAAPAHRIASPAPLPSSTAAVPSRPVETDEEAELRALQAELAM